MSTLPGAKVLLLGDTGAGKTYSIRTLVDAGLTPFVIFTEPGMESINDLNKADAPCKVHWNYIAPSTPDWDSMIDSATKINLMTMQQLSSLSDINKKKYHEFIDVLKCLHNFTCARCGKEFGDVATWGTDRALVMDSLSGLNIMAMNLVVGSKPVKSMADWGIAMDNLERLLIKLTTDTKCFMVMMGHMEREMDEVMGGIHVMASTLGKKLAPRIPRFFSDVIHSKRDGTKYSWSTATTNTVLKARNLPVQDNLPPSFVKLVEAWKSRGGEIKEAA